MKVPEYSFVIPIYNEEDTLPEFHRRLAAVMERMDGECEAVLVDDGSRDRSFPIMLEIHRGDPRFKVLQLSRNFGHQIAITAGMDHASGKAVIVMDADLQDPPEVVTEMAARWREGNEIVYAIREERRGDSWLKRATASIYYRTLRRLTDVEIPADVGDFRLVDRKALDAFRSMRESDRFVRGMFGWIGFRQTGVHFARSERFAGETKYPFRRMFKLALDGILSFSKSPLRVALNLGFLISAISFVGGVVAVVLKLSGVYTVSGWTSLIVLVAFLGGVQLMVLGMIGEYIGRIYEQVKNRPLYFIRDKQGFRTPDAGERTPLYTAADRPGEPGR